MLQLSVESLSPRFMVNYDVGLGGNITSFNTRAYEYVDIWVRIHQVQGIQQPLPNVEAMHAAQLSTSFDQHCLEEACDLNYMVALYTMVEQFNPFFTIDIEKRKLYLRDEWYPKMLDLFGCLNKPRTF